MHVTTSQRKFCCTNWEVPRALLNLDDSSRGLNTRNSGVDSLRQRKADSLLLSAACSLENLRVPTTSFASRPHA